ncbi:MAG: phosphotransferase [Gemmatimonadota bacterium]|nr:phosphotransferase [Gemmatimonadota bacterium]
MNDDLTDSTEIVRVALEKMGFDTTHLRYVVPIRERHGNRLFRINLEGSPYILKEFGDPEAASEVWAYSLLEDLEVPTVRVIARTDDTLLLEDLDVSDHLRLANEDDIGKADVGVALAEWYRTLHNADSAVRLGVDHRSSFLRREIDALTPASIMGVAARIGGSDSTEWSILAGNIDRIRNAVMDSSETLTYNDFHWTNLALSRNERPVRAVVFDYHLLGLGMRYSDCRNVTGSLGPDAADAFRSAYGDTDPREEVLDELVAPLCALVEAFRRSRFPSWAVASLELAETGEIHNRFDRVIEIL